MRKCRFCAGEIQDEAKYCPFCGWELPKSHVIKSWMYWALAALILLSLGGLVLLRVLPGLPTRLFTASPRAIQTDSSAAHQTPVANPGQKISFTQPATDAAQAAAIKHTIAWDGGPKADITTATCTAYDGTVGGFTCDYPIPGSTTFGIHTVVLTAYVMDGTTRLESAGTLFQFSYQDARAPAATPVAPAATRSH